MSLTLLPAVDVAAGQAVRLGARVVDRADQVESLLRQIVALADLTQFPTAQPWMGHRLGQLQQLAFRFAEGETKFVTGQLRLDAGHLQPSH